MPVPTSPAFRALVVATVLAAAALCGPAGAQLVPGEFHREKPIAWSKSGLEVAIRIEERVFHAEEGMRTNLRIDVRACRGAKVRRSFEILGPGKQSKKDRKQGWKVAERWLTDEGYQFVAGREAKKISLDLMETREVQPGAQNLAVPRRLAPDPAAWVQLMTGVTKSGKIAIYAAYTLPGSEKVHGGKVDEFPGNPINPEGAVCEAHWGPEGRCAAIVCAGPAEIGNERGSLRLFDSRELAKLWTFERQ